MTSGDVKRTALNPHYKYLLIFVTAAWFVSLIAMIVLAGIWKQPTDEQKHVFDILGWCFQSTTGAILGLLGGKVTS